MCLKNLLYELIIGNISEARPPNDPDETWYVKAATVTRAQIWLSTETKTLKVAEVTQNLRFALQVALCPHLIISTVFRRL